MVKPEILYDVVAQFTVGNLVYKSWGGGLVTVSAANDRDSVIEIPATVKYKGMDYRIDELEDSAFAAHPFLKRVVMPDNPKLHVMKHILLAVLIWRVYISVARHHLCWAMQSGG